MEGAEGGVEAQRDDTVVSTGFPLAKSRPLYGPWLQQKQWPAYIIMWWEDGVISLLSLSNVVVCVWQ
jgi:hypothetical protein